MKISVITINYNGSDSTLKLLESLSSQTDSDFETIVVDNASEEADFKRLKDSMGKAVLVRNENNLGFSGGNNMGIREALKRGSDWLFLLNNDTWVEKDFIISLKPILAQKEGIVGLPIDEGGEIAYAGKRRWLTYPHPFHIRDFDRAKREKNFYIIGGGLLINKKVIEKIGFLDENYFLYFEDIDYSVRARKNKIPLQVVEGPIIHHEVSSTTKKLGRPLILRYHYRNALYFNWKNGPWYIRFAIWPWSFWILKKQVFKLMIRYKPDESLAILKGIFDFYRNKMGKIR